MPVILYIMSKLQDRVLQIVRSNGKMLRLADDGRCDSPSFSAKTAVIHSYIWVIETFVTFVVDFF